MKKMMTVAAIACATLTAGAANAAVFTKKYDVSAVFKEGPIETLTASAVVIFNNGNISIASFSGSNFDIFSNYRNYSVTDKLDNTAIYFGKAINGITNLAGGTDDFRLILRVDAQGNLDYSAEAGIADLRYTRPDIQQVYASSAPGLLSVTVSDVTTAVPEPATWGLMLAGFAMVGGAIRYRRRNTVVRYA